MLGIHEKMILGMLASPTTSVLFIAAAVCAFLALFHDQVCPKVGEGNDECDKLAEYSWPAAMVFLASAACCVCLIPGMPLGSMMGGMGMMGGYGGYGGYGGGYGGYGGGYGFW